MPLYEPTEISSSTTLNNPWSGFFTVSSSSTTFGDLPIWARYRRIELRDLMTVSVASNGDLIPTYRWNDIDTLLAAGLPLGLRIRCITAGDDVPRAVPDNIPGKWCADENKGGNVFVPYWEDPKVKALLLAFIAAFGARYDGKLAWVDATIYGRWGEMHMWKIANPPTASETTIKQHIDAFAAAFPNTQLLMMAGKAFAVRHVYDNHRSKRFGLRADSMGRPGFDEAYGSDHDAEIQAAIKTWPGPNVAEFNNPVYPERSTDRATILAQVQKYGISTISITNAAEGNSWSNLTEAGRNTLRAAARLAGPRIRLERVSVPDLTVGGSFGVSWSWVNEGVAPAHGGFTVKLRLVQASNPTDSVASWSSKVDLSTLHGGVRQHTDSFVVPSNIAPGTYKLAVRIENGATPPLRLELAQTGKIANTTYLLGDVTVTASAAPPPPPPTGTPTAPVVSAEEAAALQSALLTANTKVDAVKAAAIATPTSTAVTALTAQIATLTTQRDALTAAASAIGASITALTTQRDALNTVVTTAQAVASDADAADMQVASATSIANTIAGRLN